MGTHYCYIRPDRVMKTCPAMSIASIVGMDRCESALASAENGHRDVAGRRRLHRSRRLVALFASILAGAAPQTGWVSSATLAAPSKGSVAIVLVYHRFGTTVADSMTVTTPVFAWQLKYLRDNRYNVVPLRDIVKFVSGSGSLPPRAVAITADDAHRTVFTEMKPLIEHYQIPITLFIYPSAISKASYAMTWEQLAELKATGLFSIQSHTYWHPNFRKEKKRLPPDEYRNFVATQLQKSRAMLERKLSPTVDMLAWPFGIYDDDLTAAARKAGYIAAFSIDRRNASPNGNVMAIPRYIVTDRDTGKAFANLVSGASAESSIRPLQANNPY
jgi:peptidoglycan/xylan/chitin deacetylase (PgdA/CDA1 family)